MTTLVRIGNSQGVRIPKTIIKQAQLENKTLVFKVVKEGLLIKPVQMPRQGWKESFDKAAEMDSPEQVDQEWLDAPLTDDQDWEW